MSSNGIGPSPSKRGEDSNRVVHIFRRYAGVELRKEYVEQVRKLHVDNNGYLYLWHDDDRPQLTVITPEEWISFTLHDLTDGEEKDYYEYIKDRDERMWSGQHGIEN